MIKESPFLFIVLMWMAGFFTGMQIEEWRPKRQEAVKPIEIRSLPVPRVPGIMYYFDRARLENDDGRWNANAGR
jgi:hypothetical protein